MPTYHTTGNALIVERLEQRTLLAVTFTPGPYAIPSNRPDGNVTNISPAPFPEIVMAANPHDPANIASAPGPLYVSPNAGGMYLGPTIMPLPAAYTTYGGDPVVAFDAEGRLFMTLLVASGPFRDIGIGQMDPLTGNPTGAAVALPNALGTRDDKQWLAADSNPDSPYANNLYMVWDRPGVTPGEYEVLFSSSSNQGQTWSAPLQLSDFDGLDNVTGTLDDEGWSHFAEVAVAVNGDVYVAYHSQPDMNLATLETTGQRRNPDGISGKTFVVRLTGGGSAIVSKVEAFPAGTSDVSINTQDAVNGGTIAGTRFTTAGSLQARVLPDPARPAHVYIIATDDPDNVHSSSDDADIIIARSSDNGITWSRSTIISGPSHSFQLFPTASIDRFGNIVVAWYDNRRGLTNSSGRFLLDFMATYSTDGGLTWAPEFRINDVPFDPDPGAINWVNGPPPTTRIGEYFGTALFGGTAHVAWNGNRFSGATPVGQTMYYSSFAIPGALTVTGDDATADSDDVISINPLPGNPNFIEVVVNGERQYAGLFEGLGGITIDAGGGTDTINISQTGAALPITILPSGGDDNVNINVAGAGSASVIFSDTQRIGALTVGAGGLAALPAGGSRVLTVSSLDMTGNAKLDLVNNSMIVDWTGSNPIATIQTYLTSGYANGDWNGSGINSSVAAAATTTALGFAEATDLFSVFPATFAGQSVDATAILIRHTLYGDADLSRNVNLGDFNLLAANFGQSNRRWSHGDFDFNTTVNLNDFNRLASNFGISARPGATDLGTAQEDHDDAQRIDETAPLT